MLPLGPFNPQTAHSVTRYFGPLYYDIAEELSKKDRELEMSPG